jgi:hypothetical protein
MRVTREVAAGMAPGIVLMLSVAGGPSEPASARRQERETPASSDNHELAKMYEDDQGDRVPAGMGKPIGWKVVGPRDRQREDRVKTLYESGALPNW